MQFLPNMPFKGNLKAYYKVRQLIITKCDSLIYYKVRQVSLQSVKGVITNCDKCYYKVRQVLLQSATVLLQSATGIKKCNRTGTLKPEFRKLTQIISNFGFCGKGKTGVPGENSFGADKRTKKLNPHMTPCLGIEPGPHGGGRVVLQQRHLCIPKKTLNLNKGT